MAYHFFSIKKNDVIILWGTDETDSLSRRRGQKRILFFKHIET